jgi:hypothetical protein
MGTPEFVKTNPRPTQLELCRPAQTEFVICDHTIEISQTFFLDNDLEQVGDGETTEWQLVLVKGFTHYSDDLNSRFGVIGHRTTASWQVHQGLHWSF